MVTTIKAIRVMFGSTLRNIADQICNKNNETIEAAPKYPAMVECEYWMLIATGNAAMAAINAKNMERLKIFILPALQERFSQRFPLNPQGKIPTH